MTTQGWQAWDVANKVLVQCQEQFPLDVALQLSQTLGYHQMAMAELLPSAAIGIMLAIKELRKKSD